METTISICIGPMVEEIRSSSPSYKFKERQDSCKLKERLWEDQAESTDVVRSLGKAGEKRGDPVPCALEVGGEAG